MTYHDSPAKTALRRALHLIATSCRGQGTGDRWVERILDTWASEMSHKPPAAIEEAARKWVRSEPHRPALADFLALLETTHTGSEPSKEEACDDCSGTGWRAFASHWFDHKANRRRVWVADSPCDCERGSRMARHIDDFWDYRKAVERETNRPGSIAVYVTDRAHPVLTLEERLTPEDYARHRELSRKPYLAMP